MCNHYRNIPSMLSTWAVWAGYRPREEAPAEAWPRLPALIARREGGVVVPELMIWGVPLQMRGASGKLVIKHLTNVRNFASPFWKSTLANPAFRCLVPFSSFAEPRPGKDPETGRPAEWWFRLPGQPIAAFAGVWRPAADGTRHFAFLTCEPNPLVAPLHPKAMPVILQPDDYGTWLDGSYDEACALATPFPSQLMAVGGPAV